VKAPWAAGLLDSQIRRLADSLARLASPRGPGRFSPRAQPVRVAAPLPFAALNGRFHKDFR
jgi:hypothetical protein